MIRILSVLILALLFVSPLRADEKAERILKLFASEFVEITPGKGKVAKSFQMGSTLNPSEMPVHKVTMNKPFAMAKYEVTQELYEVVMGKNPSKWKGNRNSVEMVSWAEANQFCVKATAQLRKLKLIGENEVIRLPSEAEWEYACRAGTTTPFSFAKASDINDYGWHKGNSKGEDPPVGVKKPNAWGLYDMHGYIWEWCADTWHPTYEKAPGDGSAWTKSESKDRVLRSGAWNVPAEQCRSASRFHKPAGYRSDDVGFRCVRAKIR